MLAIRGISGWISACSSPWTCTSKPATVTASPWPTTCTRAAEPLQLAGHRRVRPHLQRRVGVQRRPQPVGREVVGVLVRDQHGGGAVERRGSVNAPGIDHQPSVRRR